MNLRRPRSIYELWRRNCRAVQIKAELARAFARLQLFQTKAAPLSLLQIAYFKDHLDSDAIIYCSLILVFFVAGIILISRWGREINADYRRILEFLQSDQKRGMVEAIDPKATQTLLPFCEDCWALARMAGIEKGKLRFYCDTEDMKESAAMIESGGLICLLFSSGFFKLWAESPGAAKAIIAHELGHAKQHDTASWFFAESFAKIFPQKVMMFSFIQGVTIVGVTKLANLNEEFQLLAAFCLLAPISAMVTFRVYLLFVRYGRRQSERLADAMALMLTSSRDLQLALQTPDARLSTHSEFLQFASINRRYSIHPTRKWRIKQAQRLGKLPSGLPVQGVASINYTSSKIGIPASFCTVTKRLFFASLVPLIMAMIVSAGMEFVDHDNQGKLYKLSSEFKTLLIGITGIGVLVAVLCLLFGALFCEISRIRKGAKFMMTSIPIGILTYFWGVHTEIDLLILGIGTLLTGFIWAWGGISMLTGYFGREVN